MLVDASLTYHPPGIADTCTTISAFGPLIAYAFIAHTAIKWRAVYWFAFSIEMCSFAMVFLFYKPPTFRRKHEHEGTSKMDLMKHLDYLGLLLFAGGMTLLLLGINWVCTPPCLLRKPSKPNCG
jgi:hypothetical protein